MLNNNSAFKHKTQYKGPFEITQCWENITVILKCDAIKIRYNIRHIKPYTYDTKIEDIIYVNDV